MEKRPQLSLDEQDTLRNLNRSKISLSREKRDAEELAKLTADAKGDEPAEERAAADTQVEDTTPKSGHPKKDDFDFTVH